MRILGVSRWVVSRWLKTGAAAACLAGGATLATAQQFAFSAEPFDPQTQVRVLRMGAPSTGSYLGVGLQEVDSDRARELKLKTEEGVEITHIEDDSPASKAGLKRGDVILQYNGQHVEGMEQFSRMVRETPAGRDVKLLISRDGGQQTVVAKIAVRKPGATAQAMPRIEIPRMEMPNMPDMPRTFMMWRSGMLGIEGEALRGQLADYFGVKDGVLVRSVMKDTPAEKGGLKAGDVVLRIGDAKVATPGDISNALRSAKPKSTVAVQVMREKREATLQVTVENEPSGWGFDGRTTPVSGRGK